MLDSTRVVGFIETDEEAGRSTVTFFGDCDFEAMMLSFEEMDGVRSVIHWPKRSFLKLFVDKPFSFLHPKFDELFEHYHKTKPKYFKEIKES